MRRRAVVGFGATTLAVGLAVAAQDPAPQPTFRTEANYVRVDVFPTRGGAPVADLTADDFEVTEDKVVQKIEQFERVLIRAAGPGEGHPDPSTVAASQQAIQDPRARVFVLFLDPKHVDVAVSRRIGPLLVKALNRLIGPDDYVGVMRPGMSPRDVTFAHRSAAMDKLLDGEWWGERDKEILGNGDDVENTYAMCYPGIPGPGQATASDQGIAQEMILRRREVQTLDALEDLSVFLRGVREERKAVLAISNGWVLYGPNPNLTRPIDRVPPTGPVLGVDPRSGRLTTKETRSGVNADTQICERDRQALAVVDNEQRFHTIVDEANRSNVSVYPIDPRGLSVFDEDVVPAAGVGVGANANPMLPQREDAARLAARTNTLRRLAEGTDGSALVGTNKIADGLKRITDDLSSYYLLGYYSSGKLDGRFHAIGVRVKRPGVVVRARRGYQALRASDLVVAPPPSSAAGGAPSGALATIAAASAAVARIAAAVRDLPLRVQVTAGWRASREGHPVAAFWAVGEVMDRIPGGDLEATLTTSAGEIVSTGRSHIAPGTTSAIVAIAPDKDLMPGDYVVRVRSRSASASESISMPVTLPPPGQASGAVFVRRGPLTGNKDAPTADLRFRRSERLRVDLPSAMEPTGARLLDRTGKSIPVPVTPTTRMDPDGTRWASAELTLAPLAAADYVIEISVGDARTLVAFRVVN